MVTLTNVEWSHQLEDGTSSMSGTSSGLYYEWGNQDVYLYSPTRSNFLDELHRCGLLLHVDSVLKALEQEIGNAVYLQQLQAWSSELRNEVKADPKIMSLPPEQLYDELYLEFLENERRGA